MNEVLNEIESTEVIDRDGLAVVYRVERLEAIPNKDRIELVHLKDCGYTTICEKGHKVGDLVVFVKYDSIVPDNELFAFMKEYKFRVKPRSFTERDDNNEVVKKIYSQGIVLPLSTVDDFYFNHPRRYNEGEDLTETIGVKKYIPPVIGTGSSFGEMRKKGDFPTHIVSKTDELNLCNKIKALEEIQGVGVYITQKIEGSSVTFYLDDYTHELIVCSRNNMLMETETCKFWMGVNKHNMLEKLLRDAPWMICQAELYGVGIQKNKLGIPDVDIAIFNMVRKSDRTRLNWFDMQYFKKCGFPIVPVVKEIYSFNWTFDQLQKYIDTLKYPNGELAEGGVIRPFEPFYSQVLKELWSVKCINREYRL
jgi:RNA ligase (TIGR02306 family)